MYVLLLILFTSLTMATATADKCILLLYKRSILVSGVRGKLAGLCFVALFFMARSCIAARISTTTIILETITILMNQPLFVY